LALSSETTAVVNVSFAELKKRKKAWNKPAPRYTHGVLAKYAAHVTSASLGAVTDADLKLYNQKHAQDALSRCLLLESSL